MTAMAIKQPARADPLANERQLSDDLEPGDAGLLHLCARI